jgi:UDP-2,3-diacylglucosamine hydrolase
MSATSSSAPGGTFAPRAHVPGSAPGATRPDGPASALLFLADLHLSPAIPRTVTAFEQFIDGIGAEVAAVYILGDLFEYWIGDDMLAINPFTRRIAERLASLRARGIRLYIMHGNRDFLLGQRFAQAAGATLIDDPFVLEVFGERWVLTHGDAMCTDDVRYQRFRRVVRKPWVQRFFLAWPLRWRQKLAGNMRENSERTGAARMDITDVSHAEVRRLFDQSGARIMIQGHTHKPATHDETRAGHPATRWVLPDWELDTPRPRGGYLRVDAQGITSESVVSSS